METLINVVGKMPHAAMSFGSMYIAHPGVAAAAALLLGTMLARPVAGQAGAIGAHAVPLVTRATPTAGRRSTTEGYLSQPAVLGMARAVQGRLEAMAMINFEGLTLERGELTTGAYGEGYVDRRHPHSYVHEAVATTRTRPGAAREASLTAGRGFAAFGSDDPMVRPFVKYPVNHHLAQVLERAIAVGAVRAGALGIEASLFNGDEPSRASDLPRWSRFADSWSARATLLVGGGTELSASHASIASPEVRAGFGVDARKWHLGARTARGPYYTLVEWARTTDVDDGRAGQAYESWLAEGALTRGAGTLALRLERTDRHEEERLDDPFRVPPSTGEGHVLAITRWTTVTVSATRRSKEWMGMNATGFMEGTVLRPERRSGIVFDPVEFYGARTLAMVSAGLRITAGTWHTRMGRYGVAAATSHSHH